MKGKHMSKQTIGEHIKKARTKAGMTQVEVAARAGFSHSAVYQWETGRCQPTVSSVKQLSTVLDIGEHWLTDAPAASSKSAVKTPPSRALPQRSSKKNAEVNHAIAATWIREHPDIAPLYNNIQSYWKQLKIEISSTDMDEVAVSNIANKLNELTLSHATKLVNLVYQPTT